MQPKDEKDRLARVYHDFREWEETAHNMWGDRSEMDDPLAWAIEFTGDAELYGSYMMRVIREWPISCENALTDYNINRKAWVGHAACALAARCPQHIVRQAWGLLSEQQRTMANAYAAQAIEAWERDYRARRGLCSGVEQSVLFSGNP